MLVISTQTFSSFHQTFSENLVTLYLVQHAYWEISLKRWMKKEKIYEIHNSLVSQKWNNSESLWPVFGSHSEQGRSFVFLHLWNTTFHFKETCFLLGNQCKIGEHNLNSKLTEVFSLLFKYRSHFVFWVNIMRLLKKSFVQFKENCPRYLLYGVGAVQLFNIYHFI